MNKKNILTYVVLVIAILIGISTLYQDTDAPDKNTLRYDDYIWLEIKDARSLARERNENFRIVEMNGRPQMLTNNYKKWWINASTVDGIVTKYYLEGESPAEQESSNDEDIISDNNEINVYIGMPVVDAAELAEERGDIFRVVNIDGESQPVTEDYVIGRINASIIDGRVSEFYIDGEEVSSNDEISENTQTPTDYIGMPVVDAAELAEEKGDIFRVVNIDGESQPVTMDYRPGRINVSIIDGRVSEFYIEGE